MQVPTTISPEIVPIFILTAGTLGIVSSGIVELTKSFGGGVGNVGFGTIRSVLKPWEPALSSCDPDWAIGVRANWINRMPLADQKAMVRTLINLGLTTENAAAIAAAAHVNPETLVGVVRAQAEGIELDVMQARVLERMNSFIGIILEGAYAVAEKKYTGSIQYAAATYAMLIAISVGALLFRNANPALFSEHNYLYSIYFDIAMLVGISAVPLIPVATGLTSLLRSAADALKGKISPS